MREIKFRGKSLLTDKWVYGCLVNFGHIYKIHFRSEISGLKVYEMIDKETIGQFTGLYDVNGTEIYEGDILHHKIQGTRRVYYPFDERSASFGLEEINNGMCSYLENSFLYKKIGNIHD